VVNDWTRIPDWLAGLQGIPPVLDERGKRLRLWARRKRATLLKAQRLAATKTQGVAFQKAA
jgi:hypothetical protein